MTEERKILEQIIKENSIRLTTLKNNQNVIEMQIKAIEETQRTLLNVLAKLERSDYIANINFVYNSYERFDNLLKKNKVNANTVARETGIATATLSNWKKGRYQPKVEKIEKIANYFKVNTDYFYLREGE